MEEIKELYSYEIKRIGLLSLCYKNFIHRKAHKDEIDICMWKDKNYDARWTIASFETNDKECCYELKSCCDRLNCEELNWNDFGKIVLEGYKYLEKVNKGE